VGPDVLHSAPRLSADERGVLRSLGVLLALEQGVRGAARQARDVPGVPQDRPAVLARLAVLLRFGQGVRGAPGAGGEVQGVPPGRPGVRPGDGVLQSLREGVRGTSQRARDVPGLPTARDEVRPGYPVLPRPRVQCGTLQKALRGLSRARCSGFFLFFIAKRFSKDVGLVATASLASCLF
jgi:hypothetical protein